MDGLTLKAVASLAGLRYAGKRVDQLRWIAPGGLMIDFAGRMPGLVLSANSLLYGLYTARKGEVNFLKMPSSMEDGLRRLKGARLNEVTGKGFERVLHFRFHKRSPAGRVEEVSLIFEAISRWSNIILIKEPEKSIICAYKTIVNPRGRSILPGWHYDPPPSGDKKDPDALSEEELKGLLAAHGRKRPPSDFLKGLSADTASELIRRAEDQGEDFDTKLADLLYRVSRQPPSDGAVLYGPTGRPRLALAGVSPDSDFDGTTRDLLEAAGEFYRKISGDMVVDQMKQRLASALHRRIKKAEDLRRRLSSEFEETEKIEEYRRIGDALIAHIAEIRKGQASFRTENLFGQTGRVFEISLDPRLSPSGNAGAYYRRARKMKARSDHLKDRLAELKRLMEGLEKLRMDAESTRDLSSLEKLEKLLGDLSASTDEKRLRRNERPAPATPSKTYFEYRSSEGHRIIVGKSSASNDYILNRLSSPGDLWCHAEGFSGAHVILKGIDSRRMPPEQDLKEACMLAAYHSKGRNQSIVPVSYARRKYVHKPKGAAAGLVTLRKKQTLFVEPSLPPGVILKG